MLTQARLRDLLHYDQDTGIFTWKIYRGANAKIGKIAGSTNHDGYIAISINGKPIFAHRLAWLYIYGSLPENTIDHINGMKNDNSLKNLRAATMLENRQNSVKPNSNNTSGFLGVGWMKAREKWQAQIMVNGKKKHLGLFQTPELAHEAYLKAKRELHKFCTI